MPCLFFLRPPLFVFCPRVPTNINFRPAYPVLLSHCQRLGNRSRQRRADIRGLKEPPLLFSGMGQAVTKASPTVEAVE